jgi:hypothetical protein
MTVPNMGGFQQFSVVTVPNPRPVLRGCAGDPSDGVDARAGQIVLRGVKLMIASALCSLSLTSELN